MGKTEEEVQEGKARVRRRRRRGEGRKGQAATGMEEHWKPLTGLLCWPQPSIEFLSMMTPPGKISLNAHRRRMSEGRAPERQPACVCVWGGHS